MRSAPRIGPRGVNFGSLLSGILTEGTLHEKTAPDLGVSLEDVQPLPAAREYTDFLLATASLGTIGEHLAAMAPCAKLYGWLGTRLADQPYDDRYAFWINMYSSPDYLRRSTSSRPMLDEHGDDSDLEAIKSHCDGARVPLLRFGLGERESQ